MLRDTMEPRHVWRLAYALATVGVMGVLAGCKKPGSSASSADAGAPSGSPSVVQAAAPASWDGFFGAARAPGGARTVVVVSGAKTASLGVVELDGKGAETKRAALFQPERALASAPSVAVFSDGSLAVVYAEKAGDASSARMFTASHVATGGAVALGSDWCATNEGLYFLEKSSKRLRRWAHGEAAPSAAEGPTFADHSTPLCNEASAFVLEPRTSGFDLVNVAKAVRSRVAEGVDATAVGTYAIYVADDGVGIVSARGHGALEWTTVTGDGKIAVRSLAHKIGTEQTLVAVDGALDRVSVLLQRDGKDRCGDETPPAYDVLEVASREQLTALPLVECDSEASQPDIGQTKDGPVVRWFEWKEEGKDKRLRTWSHAQADGGASVRVVPGDTVLLDCDDQGCPSIARRDGRFVALVP